MQPFTRAHRPRGSLHHLHSMQCSQRYRYLKLVYYCKAFTVTNSKYHIHADRLNEQISHTLMHFSFLGQQYLWVIYSEPFPAISWRIEPLLNMVIPLTFYVSNLRTHTAWLKFDKPHVCVCKLPNEGQSRIWKLTYEERGETWEKQTGTVMSVYVSQHPVCLTPPSPPPVVLGESLSALASMHPFWNGSINAVQVVLH